MTNQLRILAISNHSNMLGGGEHSFLDMVSNLPSKFDVVALTPGVGELGVNLKERQVKMDILPLPALKIKNTAAFFHSLARCTRICRRFRPGIIYANGSRAGFYGGLSGRLLNIPVIWHCRIALRDRILDRILNMFADVIVSNSNATAARFSSTNRKVRVIYNGIDIKWMAKSGGRTPAQVDDNCTALVCVARLSRWKRHDRILDAFERLAANDLSIQLFCVGDRDYEEDYWWEYLQKRKNESPFADRIHWVGHVDDPRPWYFRADAFVLASENEAFGRVLVEAMCCGAPVVSVLSGGIAEVIRDGVNGVLVQPGDTAALAAAIRRVLDDRNFRDTIVKNGRSTALYYSLENHIDQMAALLEEIYKK